MKITRALHIITITNKFNLLLALRKKTRGRPKKVLSYKRRRAKISVKMKMLRLKETTQMKTESRPRDSSREIKHWIHLGG